VTCFRGVVAGVIAVAALTAACGDSKSPVSATPVAASKAVVTMTLSPSPATAIVCSPKCATATGSFDFALAVTAVLRESAGLGANIDGMEWTLSRAGGTSAPLVISPTQIISGAGTNHITASSSLSVPINVVYSTVSGAKDGTVTLVAHLTDDRGNAVTLTGTVNVQ